MTNPDTKTLLRHYTQRGYSFVPLPERNDRGEVGCLVKFEAAVVATAWGGDWAETLVRAFDVARQHGEGQ